MLPPKFSLLVCFLISPLRIDSNLFIGGSGFLATWVIKYLLQADYKVRATVRSTAKGEYLKKIFSESGDNLEYSIVEDIVAPNAFDQAVSDVDAIIHTASPLVSSDPKSDPSVTITPAIEGTLNILKSAQKVSSIKRVVITSSGGAVLQPQSDGYTYTEVSPYNSLFPRDLM